MSATPSHDGRRRGLLAIDTATARVVIATGGPDGTADGVASWAAGYRHGETLLPTIQRFLGEQNLRRSRLVGLIVGTGPGAFTGLRVGIATAKGLAHGLGIPLVGVSTAEALLHGAPSGSVLLQPAGPRDRVLTRPGTASVLLTGDEPPEIAPMEVLVAVDLEGRAPADAVERGEAAWARLGAALLELGAARLAARAATQPPADPQAELAAVVPEYVTLPRGTVATGGEVSWSRDPR